MQRLFLLILALAFVTPAHAGTDAQSATVLAQMKQAAGGAQWDAIRFVRTNIEIETSGLKGSGEALDDVHTGHGTVSFKLGTFSGASGYDGNVVWEKDTSGQIIIQKGDDQREQAANEAFRRSLSYWYPGRRPGQITYAGLKTEGTHSFHVLTMLPQGGRSFDMWVDAATYLTDRITERDSRQLQTTFLSDYRRVGGVMIAHHSRQSNGETRYDTIIKTTAIKFEATVKTAAFAPPGPPKRDFGFRGPQRSTSMPFALVNNHIYLDVRLNGRPYTFLFDTGGLNVITPTVARELGLKVEGNVQVSGAGSHSAEAGFTEVSRLEVGDAWLEKQTFVVIGLESFAQIEGRPVTGIVGYEIFKRFVVVTDYERARMTLLEPEGFRYEGPGIRVPIILNDRTPEVEGAIDGIPGKFTLDTGSRSTLDITTPFVAKHNLVARYNAKHQGITGWGVGGPVRSWVVRAKQVTFGNVKVNEPVVELSQATKGAFSDTYVAGNVGAGILKRFNIIWDYTNGQTFWEPNKYFAERDVYDRAGFWVNEGHAGFEIIDVTTASPAEAAGLKVGDIVLRINGKAARQDVTLPDFRLLKKAPAGTNLILDIARGTQRLQINILLRDMI